MLEEMFSVVQADSCFFVVVAIIENQKVPVCLPHSLIINSDAGVLLACI